MLSAVSFVLLSSFKHALPKLFEGLLLDNFNLIVSSCSNFALASVIVSLFVVLYQFRQGQRILSPLAPFGRMSLTNYLVQSILGSFIYYGYGLCLYKYTGASYSVLIASVVIFMQVVLSRWWLKNHRQGPMEQLWHKLTWIKITPAKESHN